MCRFAALAGGSPQRENVVADAENPDPVYTYKPSLVGAPWQLRLAPDALEWNFGWRSGRAPYDRIRRLRLSYRPASLQTHRFLAEVWPENSPRIDIASASFRG